MKMDEVNDSEDHYVIYGHALPEIDEEGASSKKLKPIPIEEQVVTDENGRRRFHGAFTGGFSAGFFNTAGSRDGWTPKNFKSTRENRFQANEQRPEDFMDDDDMGEFGIAPQKLQTSSKFRQENEKKRKHAPAQTQDQPIPGDPVLEQFIKPAEDTIGVKLLKEMGWKPGQGIGPKLTKKSKKTKSKSTRNLFGPMMRKAESSDEEIDEQYKDFLFAPDDIPNFVAKPKSNFFGIGYKGLERSDVFGNQHVNLFGPEVLKFDNADKAKKGRKMKISGQAFGVGAYEEDDEDIYQRDDMSKYDFSLDFNSPEDQKKDPKKRSKSRWGEAENIIQCIEGFSISEKSSVLQKKFDPPTLPKGFTPKGLRGKKSRFEPSKEDSLDTTNPTSNQRKSVINTEAEKEQFAQEPPTESEEQIKAFLAENFKESTEDFKPFNKDPAKQKRYEQYLVCLKNGRKNALPILQPKSMPDWERERERVEFERASLLFKPLNFNMSSRFVSAGTSEEVKDVKITEKILNESENAVKMKLYGKLTREIVDWHPARLLCVRFNVKPPYGDSSVIGTAPMKSKFDVFGRLNELPMTDKDKHKPVPAIESETKKTDDVIEDNVVITENDKEDNDKVPEKPSMDLFQSIFLASSDSSSNESEVDEPKNNDKEPTKKDIFGTELVKDTTEKPWEKKPENTLRNPNPNRGIFANVDLDKLNAKKDVTNPVVITTPSSKPNPMPSSSGRMSAKDFFGGSDNTFGPAKPKETVKDFKSKETSTSSEEDEWVEKSERKHKKHKKEKKKKSKKSKKKKSKSSKSKKKHKSRDYSSSDTESD